MSKREWLHAMRITLSITIAGAVLTGARAEAQVVRVNRGDSRQAIGFNIGYFAVRGEDSRVDNDVLLADLSSLAFLVKDFNGATLGGEWLYGVGDYVETGLGLGFYQRTVPSVYRDFTNSDGSEIAQDLKLRVVPISATIRFLPIGRGNAVEPYVGAGVGIFHWRYSETGEFVDFTDSSIFRSRYVADGNAVGPVVLAGLRAPVADVWTVGGEIRWQRAEGDKLLDKALLADKIDLGGWSTSFTVHLRF